MSNNTKVTLDYQIRSLGADSVAADAELVQKAIDSIQGRSVPLFPDQSKALGRFTVNIKKVKKVHDDVARSIGSSTRALAKDAFAVRANLIKTANEGVTTLLRLQAAARDAARPSAGQHKQLALGGRQRSERDQIKRRAAVIAEASARELRIAKSIEAANNKAEKSTRALAKARRDSSFGKLLDAEKRLAKERAAGTTATKRTISTEHALAQALQKVRDAETIKAKQVNIGAATRAKADAAKRAAAVVVGAAKQEEQAAANAAAVAAKAAKSKAVAEQTAAAAAQAAANKAAAASNKVAAAVGKRNRKVVHALKKEAIIRKRTANTGFKNLIAAEKKLAGVTEKVAVEEKKVGAVSGFLINRLTKLSRVVAIVQGPLGPIAGRLTASAAALRSMGVFALAGGLALGAVGKALRRAIPAAIDMQRTMGTLSAATADAAKSFEVVIKSSERTGNTLGTMANAYSQLAAAARGTSLEGEGINKVFHAINTAGLALRLDANQTKGAMKALEQMLSKGTVSSEELRQQLGERLPGAFRLAADSMGLTTAELSKQLAAGKILAEDLLPKLAAAMEKAYGKAAKDAQNTLGVAIKQLTQSIDELFASAINPDLLNIFTVAVKGTADMFRGLAAAMRESGKSSFSLVSILKDLFNIAVAIVGIGLIKHLLSLRSVMAGAVGPTRALVAEMVVLEAQTTAAGRAAIATGALMKTMWVGALAGLKKFALAAKAFAVANPLLLAITAATTAYEAFLAIQNKALDAQNAKSAVPIIKEIRKALDAEITHAKQLEDTINSAGASAASGYVKRLQKQLDDSKRRINNMRLSISNKVGSKAIGRDTQTEAILSQLDNAVERTKKVTAAAKARNTALAKIAKITELEKKYQKTIDDTNKALAKSGHSVDTLSGKERKAFVEAQQHLAQLKKDRVDVMKRRVKLDEVVSKEDAKRASTKAKQDKAARTAALKSFNVELVSSEKISAAAVRTDNIKKQLALRAGSRARLLQEQLMARNELDSKQTIKLINSKTTAETNALLAQRDNERKALDEHQRMERASFDADVARIRARSNIIDLANRRRLRDARRRLEDSKRNLSDTTGGGHINSGNADAARRDARIQEDFKAAKKAAQAKLDLSLAAAVTAKDQQQAIDMANSQFKDDLRASELQKDQALADSKLALWQDHHQKMLDLQQTFEQLGSDSQSVNLQTLSDGVFAFGERVGGIKDLMAAKDLAHKQGDAKREHEVDKQLSNAKLSLASDTLGAISGLMKSHNRAAFEVGKAAAIGQAIVDTFSAVNKALASAPPPFNFALAAIVGAAGALNVAKIAKTKFGGKGAASARASIPSGTVGSGAGSVPPTPTPLAPKPVTQITIINQGNVLTPDFTANEIMPHIKDLIGNGDHIIIQPGSAQHQVLAA